MRKKIVWLPYDFDTALGINNEGALVFSYNLEDIDHLTGGADVFNGQDSVVWKNMRAAFFDEIKAMYQELRSDGVLSYETVEAMFEEHQDKWSEAIFNEDSYYKYLAPLVAPDAGKEPTGAYLSMLQGSKKEQRKWWLYNRFRYMDSKYNAGDALSDVIQIRGYAKANVTVTPYADVYASVKYGSYLVQERAERNVPVTLICPLDRVNDTEIYIYSASQLGAVGDLSGFQVGFADFSMGTKLQSLKIGDSTEGWSNANLKELYLGNNALLKTLDVRNCVGLGDTSKEGHTQKTVDISGCTNIENVYFDGTMIQGLTLPNGGVLKVLHLPSTITNLTIQNQLGITDLTIPSYANISTLRLENTNVDSKSILMSTPDNARVRLIGFTWNATNATEIRSIFTKLDAMRGLDEAGDNVDTAQVSGTIHTASLTGAEIAEFNAWYPFVNVTADHISCTLNYYSYDGQTLLESQTILDGGDGSYAGTPARPSTAQYIYNFVGWNSEMNQEVAEAGITEHVTTDRNVYAAYSKTLRTYTATFVRASEDGGGTLYTQTNVPYGTIPVYGGATPTTTKGDATEWAFNGWSPTLAEITGDTTYTAQFRNLTTKTGQLIMRTITDISDDEITDIGQYAFYACMGVQSVSFPNVVSIGTYAFANLRSFSEIYAPKLVSVGGNAFSSCYGLERLDLPALQFVGASAFNYCSKLSDISIPQVKSIYNYGFYSCSMITTVSLPNIVKFSSSAFLGCRNLMSVYLLSTSIASIAKSNVFNGTPMLDSSYTGAFGSIYVPASLVSTYKSRATWSWFSDRITAFVE